MIVIRYSPTQPCFRSPMFQNPSFISPRWIFIGPVFLKFWIQIDATSADMIKVKTDGFHEPWGHDPFWPSHIFPMGLTSTTNEWSTATRSSFSDKAPQAIDEDSTTLGKPAGQDDGRAKRWASWGGKTKGMGTQLGFENTFTKLVVYKLLDFRLPRKFKKAWRRSWSILMNWFLMVNLRYWIFDGYHITMSLVDSNPFSNTKLCSPLSSRLKKELVFGLSRKKNTFQHFWVVPAGPGLPRRARSAESAMWVGSFCRCEDVDEKVTGWSWILKAGSVFF